MKHLCSDNILWLHVCIMIYFKVYIILQFFKSFDSSIRTCHDACWLPHVANLFLSSHQMPHPLSPPRCRTHCPHQGAICPDSVHHVPAWLLWPCMVHEPPLPSSLHSMVWLGGRVCVRSGHSQDSCTENSGTC